MKYVNKLLIVTVALFSGCTEDVTGPEVGESFTLAVGERVMLPATGAHVQFLEVTEDSRCPLRAQCVWAGDGVALFELAARRGEAVELTLHTNEGPKAVDLGRYEISFIELSPYPEVPDSIDPADYQATLVLSKQPE